MAPRHLEPLLEVLERTETEPVRAIVNLPPRHSKTESLLHFIARRLCRKPTETIAYATYGHSLAVSKSRLAREYAIRSGLRLRSDAAAVHEWRTQEMGGALFTSIGGAITGQGANVLIVDDPHKDRTEAESELHRDAVWAWYTGTGYYRLEPGGSVIVCQCMTGDTPVLMSDGTDKPLRDVRTGDSIATYADGTIGTSTVRNWANQGPDIVFAITTQSGIVVRANERHPFLVQREGHTEWVRVRDLRVGDAIVRTMPPAARGVALSAPPKAATDLQSARGCATLITARQEPRPDTHAPHIRPTTDAERISDTGTASSHPNTTRCSSSKVDSAPCARSHQSAPNARTGAESSVSTTTTGQGVYADCCVTDAISPSDLALPQTFSSAPLNTYAITSDAIVSIAEEGTEDVFDIEVAATENFIANGLVSHNTRWHPDDLTGRLLKEHAHENWEIINLPALGQTIGGVRVADDEGEPLWPAQWPKEALLKKRAIDAYEWRSQFQQSPVGRGGAVFHGAKFYSELPVRFRVGKGCDLAYTAKTRADFSCAVVLLEHDGFYYVVDVRRAQCEAPAFAAVLDGLNVTHPSGAWHWFCSTTEKGVAQLLTDKGVYVEPVLATADKFVRAQPVATAWNEGRVLLPRDAPWLKSFIDEIGIFTGVSDKRDDQVDALASAFESVRYKAHKPKIVPGDGSRWSADDRGFG